MIDFDAALSFLAAQSTTSVAAVFWFTLVFEIPRYGLPLAALVFSKVMGFGRGMSLDASSTVSRPLRVSVLVVGHNEANSLERCVRSLRTQSFSDFEIVVVSDGSTDGMRTIASRLLRAGLIDRALCTDLRGGKSSALNLGIATCSGDLVVNVDCDCSYERFALLEILRPFQDATVGAVCGDIVPRNGSASLVAKLQEIEYLLTISVGKRLGDAVDQIVCLSGAFTAFRREALDSVDGFDVGGGEDFDITLRLRSRGWRVAFSPKAVCYTDVPTTAWALTRQRLRWERDSVRIRFRKLRDTMRPSRSRFLVAEAAHQWEFLVFSVAGAALFPVYVVWLFVQLGTFALPVLVAMQIGLFLLDLGMLAAAAHISGRPTLRSNIAFLPAYSVAASYGLRLVRAWAYVEEWFLFASVRDNFVPAKVRVLRKW